MHLTLLFLSVLGGVQCKNVLLIIADDAGLEVGSSADIININDPPLLTTDRCTGKSRGEDSTSGQTCQAERCLHQSIHLGEQLLPQQVSLAHWAPCPPEWNVRPPPLRASLQQL